MSELIRCWCRISKRNVSTKLFLGRVSTVLTSSQYDDECAEVDVYRQKQVFWSGSVPYCDRGKTASRLNKIATLIVRHVNMKNTEIICLLARSGVIHPSMRCDD